MNKYTTWEWWCSRRPPSCDIIEQMKSASVVLALSVLAIAAQAGVVFQDTFAVPGSQLDLSKWITEIGPTSFLGRTQLADWVTPGPGGVFVVGASGAELALNTHNPSGDSLFGTHAKTLTAFQPTASSTIALTTRMQLTSLHPGIVFATYFYGCSPGTCAASHDEIDIELVTNMLQPGTLQVQLNRYANEPLGAGNGVVVDLPPGFDPLAVHDWTIRWSLTSIEFLVDGTLLYSTTTHVPQGPMHANVIAWGPGPEWPAAYSASLQSVASANLNQRFVASLTSVTVTDSSVPEPGTSAMMLFGVVALLLRHARRTRIG